MNLYVVATPIGNLEDITLRAINTLKNVNLIAAEDTRHSRILLNHYEIDTPTTSFHAHTNDSKVQALIGEMLDGKNIALISDAGTPGISDPGWKLISEAQKAGINVIPIPGPSAFLTALMGSGLPMDKFIYLGFIPAKKGRQTLFESIKDTDKTVVMYESPHRIMKTLSQMADILGEDREIILARELTKMHETFHRGTLSQLIAQFEKEKPRGEIVLLLGPAT